MHYIEFCQSFYNTYGLASNYAFSTRQGDDQKEQVMESLQRARLNVSLAWPICERVFRSAAILLFFVCFFFNEIGDRVIWERIVGLFSTHSRNFWKSYFFHSNHVVLVGLMFFYDPGILRIAEFHEKWGCSNQLGFQSHVWLILS